MNDELFWWERWPVGALFAAQGLYVWEWYVGARMPQTATDALGWLAVAGGVAAWLAIDGAMIATVAGMRQGRRSAWSVAAIVVTALFGAAVALNGHGELQQAGAWLHAGFAATITCYLLHLAQPREAGAPALPKPRRWREWLPQWGRASLTTAAFSVEAPTRNSPKVYTCRKCQATGFSFDELGRHARGCQGAAVVPVGD